MANRPVLITGCQRSGTTLLHLILDSHPQVRSIDELFFGKYRVRNYLTDPRFHPVVAFKLPAYAPQIDWIRELLPDLRVLWCLRDPRDVVASMLKLRLPLDDGGSLPWTWHPQGAAAELERCVPALPAERRGPLSAWLQRYQALEQLPLEQRTRLDATLVGALCWQVKNELPRLYQTQRIPYCQVRYETLVAQPQERIREILDYLGLPWHDDVLRHHQLHNGKHLGNTDYARPIDTAVVGRWRGTFSDEELALIADITQETAGRFGYPLRPTADGAQSAAGA